MNAGHERDERTAHHNKEQEFRELEPIDQWEQEERKPSIFIKIFAVIAIILLIAYIFTSEPIQTIIAGLLDSSPLQGIGGNHVVKVKGIAYADRMVFVNNSYNHLLAAYDANLGKEFPACLLGTVEGKEYTIESMYVPNIYSQTETEVIFTPCSPETIVSLHSHPEDHCLPSGQDVSNFESFHESNPLGLLAVMCERGRFNFYAAD